MDSETYRKSMFQTLINEIENYQYNFRYKQFCKHSRSILAKNLPMSDSDDFIEFCDNFQKISLKKHYHYIQYLIGKYK